MTLPASTAQAQAAGTDQRLVRVPAASDRYLLTTPELSSKPASRY